VIFNIVQNRTQFCGFWGYCCDGQTGNATRVYGHHGKGLQECSPTTQYIHNYEEKTSGALLDRIDIRVEAPPVKYDGLSAKATGGQRDRGSGDYGEKIRGKRRILL
jgi:hypothetical protein